MSYTEKHILEAYMGLFAGLSSVTKLELIERLSKSMKTEKKNIEKEFYNSFGAFSSEKTAEEIIKEIKGSRKFRKKEIKI